MKKAWWLFLSIKYWIQGDTWEFAKEYAESIVFGFKRTKEEDD